MSAEEDKKKQAEHDGRQSTFLKPEGKVTMPNETNQSFEEYI